MSWLAGLAGKAEDFLNKIDQNAGQALQKERDQQQYAKSGDFLIEVSTDKHMINNHSAGENVYQQSYPYTNIGSTSKSPGTRPATYSSSVPLKQPKIPDEQLMDFLNSPLSVEAKRTIPAHVPSQASQSMAASVTSQNSDDAQSTGSLPSNSNSDSIEDSEKTGMTIAAEDKHHSRNSSTGGSINQQLAVAEDKIVQVPISQAHEVNVESTLIPSVTPQLQNHHVSDIEMENKLLRNEIQSLNQEMAQVLQRAKYAEKEMAELQVQLLQQGNLLRGKDQMLMEQQARDSNLQEELQSRDANLALLEKQIEEGKLQLSAAEERINSVKLENERLLRDSANSSGLQQQTLQNMQDKLAEREANVESEKRAFKKAQEEATERIKTLEKEKLACAENLTEVQNAIIEEQNQKSVLQQQITAVQLDCESAWQELADYKQKAQRILQFKEKLITSLKENNGEQEAEPLAELEHVQQERDLLREEVQQMNAQLKVVRNELQEVEKQMSVNAEISMETQQKLQEMLNQEKQQREEAEKDCQQQSEELHYLREDLTRQKTMFATKLQSRDEEITKLRSQLTAKQLATTSETELEARLHTLTDNLFQKQIAIETLSTEKSSLLLQCERLEKQYREMKSSVQQSQLSVTGNVNDTDDVKSRIPSFLMETPFDTGVTRKVKRAYSTVDSFSIRLGAFLRRYPIARIFVITYMVLLHVWVMIVLLTYTPEIHGPDYHLPNISP